MVVDRATFPRDKVCAGWITPQVVDELRPRHRRVRAAAARSSRSPAFASASSAASATSRRATTRRSATASAAASSITICCGGPARGCALGEPRREHRAATAGSWIVNDAIRAPMLVGAGGHFCPVARLLNGGDARARPLVVAQEAEFADRTAASSTRSPVEPDVPGAVLLPRSAGLWLVRAQGRVLNVGLGPPGSPIAAGGDAAVRRVPRSRRAIPRHLPWRWRGHSYAVHARRTGRWSTRAWCWSATRRRGAIRRAAKGSVRRSNRVCSPRRRSSTPPADIRATVCAGRAAAARAIRRLLSPEACRGRDRQR